MAKTRVRNRSSLRDRGVGDVRPPYRFDGGEGSESGGDPQSMVRLGMKMFLVAITMMFAALAAIYLVRLPVRADFPFELPRVCWFSTAVILISSLSMQAALKAARRQQLMHLRRWLALTFALGWLFLMLQLIGWFSLHQGAQANLYSGLFYLFTGLHGLHLLGGLVFLAWLLYQAMRSPAPPADLLPIEMGALYWHFLDALWVALFTLMHVR